MSVELSPGFALQRLDFRKPGLSPAVTGRSPDSWIYALGLS